MPNPPPTYTLPSATAAPDQVRIFISQLLRERGIPAADIQNVATRWKIGSGREMRAYDPSMYLDVFGAEYGWIIYRDVKLQVHEEKCEKLTYKYGTELIAVGLAVFTAAMFYISSPELGALPLTLAVCAGLFGGFGLIVAVVLILVAGTPEEDIEAELRECRSKGVAKKD